MKTIVTCNVYKDYNFGGPSILCGFYELMKYIFVDDFKIINLEGRYVNSEELRDIPIESVHHELPSKKTLYKCFFGSSHTVNLVEVLKIIKSSDVIVDLYGICFCEKLNMSKMSSWRYFQRAITAFFVSWLAKNICNKKVVKNSASYGPIISNYNKKLAKYMCNDIFDVIVARERLSHLAINNEGISNKKILDVPDVANLMPYDKNVAIDSNKISISISYQIKKQWHSKEDYVLCISNLCTYLMAVHGYKIVLIPNEYDPAIYNDINVADEILQQIYEHNESRTKDILILPVERMTAVEVKNEIASSYVLLSSRYHSCVAGLSSCTPTFSIGWHYKYDELLTLYGQNRWQLDCNNCTSKKLIDAFDEFLNSRDKNVEIIREHKEDVREKVIQGGIKMFHLAGVI